MNVHFLDLVQELCWWPYIIWVFYLKMSLNIYGPTILIMWSQLRFIVESLLPNVLVLWVVLIVLFVLVLSCAQCCLRFWIIYSWLRLLFSNVKHNNMLSLGGFRNKKNIEGLVSVLELCANHKEIFKKCINIYFSLNFRVNCTYNTYWAYPKVDA
jgi:hypothetical protein